MCVCVDTEASKSMQRTSGSRDYKAVKFGSACFSHKHAAHLRAHFSRCVCLNVECARAEMWNTTKVSRSKKYKNNRNIKLQKNNKAGTN